MMKSVKLLLTTNVYNLGIVGDVVTVKPGTARNYLVPRGMATEPTQGNIDRLAEKRKQVAEEIRREHAEQEQLVEQLTDHEITIHRSANEQGSLFGGVSQHDIADLLREEGFQIDDHAVRIGEQIKRLDSYEIPIMLASDMKTQIKLWVVSDKPIEDLDADIESDGGSEEAASLQQAEEG